MEQDERLYQFKMGSETFRFEAHSEKDAENHRKYALLHFQEKLGAKFSEKALLGPEKVTLPAAFHVGQ